MPNTDIHKTDALVIGAGVVGIAVARELALAGMHTILLEKEEKFGMETSSRSSEVIHAGIYYPAGSMKARMCIEGRDRLYDYCRARHVPHKNCGKLIVLANESQRPKLEEVKKRAKACDAGELREISADEVRALEPEVRGANGLFSPQTGIIDSHAYMEAMLADFHNLGGTVVYRAPVLDGECKDGSFILDIGGEDPCQIETTYLVNSAGLHAISFLHKLKGFPSAHVPKQYYAKGNYFVLNGKNPFNHLVYPVPEEAGLGIHATLDMGGACRFGPDVEWLKDTYDYSVDPQRKDSFVKAIQSYWPGLNPDSLVPGYAGIRPKLQAPHEPAADFMIQSQKTHGIHGLINLLGIESPGLTSSLALSAHVKGLLLS